MRSPPEWVGLRRHRATRDELGLSRFVDGRGRSAEKPSDIPARGWKDILWRVYEGISDNRILANAAAVTFYALLALFPALAALVSIYGLFADPASMQHDTVSGLLPGGAVFRISIFVAPIRNHPLRFRPPFDMVLPSR
jgi:hypothetical protein